MLWQATRVYTAMLGIVLGSAAVSAGGYALLHWRFRQDATTHGSASYLSLCTALQKNLFRRKGMIVGDWSFADLPVYYDDTHAITFGPSGSGKGTAAIVPAILDRPFAFINCSIPDDHISPRRSALFMARSVLRELRDGGRPC